MYRFWSTVIEPIFEALRPETVVEVGSDHGFNTRNLAEWSVAHDAVLHVVDPLPKYDVDEFAERYGDAFVFHRSLSLNALGRIGPADAVLIDGDHNWYTVYHELELLRRQARKAGAALPVVLLHDVGWPYGRRDLYYDPDTIPDAYRKPYARKGMRPGMSDLLDEGGLNAHLCNSIYENDLQNGVMTAVEDYLATLEEPAELRVVPAIHGLGMLLPEARLAPRPALRRLLEELAPSRRVSGLIEMVEAQRLEAETTVHELKAEAGRLEAERQARVDELEDKLRRQSARATEAAEFAKARLARHAADREDALRRAQEAEQTVSRERSKSEVLQQELAAHRRSADKKVQVATQQAQAAEQELKAVRRRNAELARSYERLQRRRVVRLALLAARPFRPVFRVVRRVRSPSRPATAQATNGESKGSGQAAPELWNGRRMLDDLATVERLRQVGPVTVIVPIHNAHAELRRCLDALVRNTTWPARLLLIDDASTEPEIGGLLAEMERLESVTVLRNDVNLGFVRTVNRGFAACDTDVVVLNSDTAVTPRWLENLVFAAYRGEDVGTATPLSNNAGAFAVPDLGKDNPYPAHLDFDDVGRLIAQSSQRRYPRAPTGNGFCLYVKKGVLDEVGGFDAEAFPRGYGEENDLCMRAGRAGWRHVVDDAGFVFHTLGASFTTERETLMRLGRQKLDARYPEYTGLVRSFVKSPSLRAVQEAVRAVYEEARHEAVRPRVLYVIHNGQGGTPQTNLDLMQHVHERYDCLLLTSDTRSLVLHRLVDGELQVVDRWVLDTAIAFGQTSREDYRRVVAAILIRFGIELVHIRHLFKHTLDLPEIASALGIPVVLSLHDFYFSCPTIHLLDDQDRFCGGVCTPGQGTCRIPTRWVRDTAPPLKHDWVNVWRSRVGEILPHCDAFVTTSPTARNIYLRSYPGLQDKPFEVIEHGRDMVAVPSLAEAPVPGEPVRILIPGNLDVHKGGGFIADLKAIDQSRGDRLEFHFIGDTAPDFGGLGVLHGRYQRHEFNDLVKRIRPAFVGLFSIWAETYSHTLTEAWAAGVPVFASGLGALGERLRAGGGGWIVDVSDPVATYEAMLAVAGDPSEYERVRTEATLDTVRSVAEMGADYESLYQRVRSARRSLATAKSSGRYGTSVPAIGLAVAGKGRSRPGSVHVRTLRRFGHPAVAGRVQPQVLDLHAFLRKEVAIDLLYVQRTAVPPELTDKVIERCRLDDVPLVIDLDDNLVEPEILAKRSGDWGLYVDSLQALLREAAIATVSTPRLAEVVAGYSKRVEVVPNQLDERLWFGHVDPYETSTGDSGGSDRAAPLRLLYMGTNTHGEDLELLRPVLPSLRAALRREVTLDVIGGEPEGLDQRWYTRVAIPPGRTGYDRFVPWLRGAQGRWDIAVAPLAVNQFNVYKSDLKFLEYSALGLPGVYSRLDPYSDTVVDGVTGLLADADPRSWVSALTALAETGARKAMAGRAYAEVLQNRTMRVHASAYLDVLFEAVSEAV